MEAKLERAVRSLVKTTGIALILPVKIKKSPRCDGEFCDGEIHLTERAVEELTEGELGFVVNRFQRDFGRSVPQS